MERRSRCARRADQFSLDAAGFGQGAIAYRQQPAAGGPLAGTRIMLATIPETSAPDAAAFGDAADRRRRRRRRRRPSRPGRRRSRSTASATPRPRSASRSAACWSRADDRDRARAGAPRRRPHQHRRAPAVDLAASGAAVAAWQIRRGERGRHRRHRAARRRRPGHAGAGRAGGRDRQRLRARRLRPRRRAGRLGPGRRRVAAVVVDAPPDPFAVQTPDRLRAHAAGAPLGHAGARDRRRDVRGHDRRRHRRREPHAARARAAARATSTTASRAAGRRHRRRRAGDDEPPGRAEARPRASRGSRVQRFRNRLVQVRVTDGTTGVDNTSVRVRWGDGKRSSGRRTAAHRYRAGGPFRVTVTARDKAGNRVTVRKKVAVSAPGLRRRAGFAARSARCRCRSRSVCLLMMYPVLAKVRYEELGPTVGRARTDGRVAVSQLGVRAAADVRAGVAVPGRSAGVPHGLDHRRASRAASRWC